MQRCYTRMESGAPMIQFLLVIRDEYGFRNGASGWQEDILVDPAVTLLARQNKRREKSNYRGSLLESVHRTHGSNEATCYR